MQAHVVEQDLDIIFYQKNSRIVHVSFDYIFGSVTVVVDLAPPRLGTKNDRVVKILGTVWAPKEEFAKKQRNKI